jgi:hypothetical protein
MNNWHLSQFKFQFIDALDALCLPQTIPRKQRKKLASLTDTVNLQSATDTGLFQNTSGTMKHKNLPLQVTMSAFLNARDLVSILATLYQLTVILLICWRHV